jgi:hypothetical protein
MLQSIPSSEKNGMNLELRKAGKTQSLGLHALHGESSFSLKLG